MTDADFLAAFEACTIPRADWTHEAHVRMAWLYLTRLPFADALHRVRAGIRRYNDSLGGTGYHDSWAAFVQLARAFGRWIPFVRWEKGDFSQDDNYFLAQDSGRPYERWAAGLRFDLTASAALKLEFDYTTFSVTESSDTYELLVQYAIRF